MFHLSMERKEDLSNWAVEQINSGGVLNMDITMVKMMILSKAKDASDIVDLNETRPISIANL